MYLCQVRRPHNGESNHMPPGVGRPSADAPYCLWRCTVPSWHRQLFDKFFFKTEALTTPFIVRVHYSGYTTCNSEFALLATSLYLTEYVVCSC